MHEEYFYINIKHFLNIESTIYKYMYFNVYFIYAKRLTSYGSPGDHCIDNQERERRSHLATNYGPVGLQRTTQASSERHQWT